MLSRFEVACALQERLFDLPQRHYEELPSATFRQHEPCERLIPTIAGFDIGDHLMCWAMSTSTYAQQVEGDLNTLVGYGYV